MDWVGLGWVGSHFPAHVMGWVGLNEKYCYYFHCIFSYVLRKFANKASNANAVYRQTTRYSCFTEESWAIVGLEFGVQWVGVFTSTWQSVNQSQPETGYLFHQRTWKNMCSTVLVSAFHVGVWWVCWVGSISWWVELGWVKKNGPTSISGIDVENYFSEHIVLNHIL